MYKRLSALFKNQNGEGTLTLPILILIVVMMLYMGVDILGIYSTHQKLRLAVSETLTLMKIDNGWDAETEVFFNNVLNQAGLGTSVIVNYATPKQVKRGTEVTLDAETSYEVRSLKPFDRTIIVPVKVKLTGLAQEFIR